MPLLDTLVLYGVGLLGGSLGLAAKKNGVAGKVLGIGRNEERLHQAKALGAIDDYTTSLSDIGPGCDLTIICTPVSLIPQIVLRFAEVLPPESIITDVGSTKATLIKKIFSYRKSIAFVGSHPLAGSEKTGVEHARADLYEKATCIVTPTDTTPIERTRKVETFWESLGASVVRLTPEQHDQWVAATSHIPHLAATALSLLLGRLAKESPIIFRLIGSGFLDTTRIAAGDPGLWRDICLDNSSAIREALDLFIKELQQIQETIHQGESQTIEEFLAKGQSIRQKIKPDSALKDS